MRKIHIDLETYSSEDLAKTGVYKYAEAPDFEILLFGYSVDGSEVKVVDLLAGEKIPEDIIEGIKCDDVIKVAHNANFERICLSRYLNIAYLNPVSWRCTMVWSAYLGLPLSLKGVGAVLGLDKQKMEEGKELIRYFCVPRTPTKTRPETRNKIAGNEEKWNLFKKYNVRDVEVEIQIEEKLSIFPVPEFVWEEYCIDQEINDRGVLIDEVLVSQAIEMDQKSKQSLKDKMVKITELENPNSVQQLSSWLGQMGLEIDTLGKKNVDKLIEEADGEIKEVLLLRQQLAKSSVKKYQAMANAVCHDGRVRGMFQFYGANRTGRFSGKIVQMQNLRRNDLEDLDVARELVRSGNMEAVDLLYGDVPDTLSQLIRTAFIPKPGCLFYVADYSAIEARVLAWLAGEQWVLDVFENGGDIYCATAGRMFGVKVEKHGLNGELRQKGKQATLSCGYGGGVGAMIAMGAIESGMKEEELQPMVDYWRQANPNIVKLWYSFDRAAKTAIKERTTTDVRGIRFTYQSGFLFMTLPSGRRLAYVKPRMGENRFGGESITYEGVGGTKKWERLETFGGKLVENCVQAIARDLLVYAMRNLRNERICMHIHDELVLECKEGTSLEEICLRMGKTPDWADGLILRADGYTCESYRKD